MRPVLVHWGMHVRVSIISKHKCEGIRSILQQKDMIVEEMTLGCGHLVRIHCRHVVGNTPSAEVWFPSSVQGIPWDFGANRWWESVVCK
jgi:hypothetical protein